MFLDIRPHLPELRPSPLPLATSAVRWLVAGLAVWLSQSLDFAPRLVQLQRMETDPDQIVLLRTLLAAAVSLAAGWLVWKRHGLLWHWMWLFCFGLLCLLARLVDLLTG